MRLITVYDDDDDDDDNDDDDDDDDYDSYKQLTSDSNKAFFSPSHSRNQKKALFVECLDLGSPW